MINWALTDTRFNVKTNKVPGLGQDTCRPKLYYCPKGGQNECNQSGRRVVFYPEPVAMLTNFCGWMGGVVLQSKHVAESDWQFPLSCAHGFRVGEYCFISQLDQKQEKPKDKLISFTKKFRLKRYSITWLKYSHTISSLREACKGIPICKFLFISQVCRVKVQQINLRSKIPGQYYALINRARGPYEEIFVLTFKAYGLNAVRSMQRLQCQSKFFPYGPKSRLIRALLYTYPNKTV